MAMIESRALGDAIIIQQFKNIKNRPTEQEEFIVINRIRRPLMRCFSVLALALLVAGSSYAGQREREVRKQTALDRYVYKPDPNYGYKLVNTSKGEG